MKALHFILILAFMFTLAISPAQAKAGERYAFVSLVTQADPNTPLQLQAQAAFEALLPKLRTAQKSGEILEFEPEFNAGILKIKYAASADVSTFTKAQVLDDIQAAVDLVPHPRKTAEGGGGVSVPNFSLSLYGSCFAGSGLGGITKVVGSIRNKAGAIVANVVHDSYSDGWIYACFGWNGPNSTIQPGYKITYKIYNKAGGALLNTYTTIAPNITLDDTDRANSVATGTGPAGKSYSVDWWHANLDAGRTYNYGSVSSTISAQGTFQVDFGSTPFRGHDSLEMVLTQNANFSFDRSLTVRYVDCTLDTNHCLMRGFPFQKVSAKIVHAGVPYILTGTADLYAYFDLDLYDAQGNPILLAPGDTVEATGVPLYRLPNLTARVDWVKDIVSGVAPANTYFLVDAYDPYANQKASLWIYSRPALNYYAVDFTSELDLKSRNVPRISIYYTDPATGNSVTRQFVFGP